jgi:hypothetical protein
MGMASLHAYIHDVIPAKAGTQAGLSDVGGLRLDSRFRGNDGLGNCCAVLEA